MDAPAEVVLGRPDDMLDTEAPIDMEMLLVANVELLKGGDVNGWLDDDAVDSGYGPIWLELDADAELTVGDVAPLPEVELDPATLELLDATEAVGELTVDDVGDAAPLLVLEEAEPEEAELEPVALELLDVAEAVNELTVGDTAPPLVLEEELDPATLELLAVMEADDELALCDPAALLLLETELDPAMVELLDVK